MITCKICQAVYREVEDECPNAINHEGLGKDDYKTAKKDELVAICQEKRIELTGNESKAELIELLKV